jgi:dihydroxyacid dehydratase/phosphogluconate dehydratase
MGSMTLRSNFEPGTSRWATRRAQWRALGLTDEDMEKPKIAIVNSSSQLAICFSHLDEIARRARRAVELAGGVAFEVRTAAPSDFITSAGHRTRRRSCTSSSTWTSTHWASCEPAPRPTTRTSPRCSPAMEVIAPDGTATLYNK